VTVYVPGVVTRDVDTVSVDAPVPFGVSVMLLGLRDVVGSLRDNEAVVSTGATEVVRLTVELKL